MKIKQDENELVIQEAPGCLWIFGLFFAAIGSVFVYGSLGGFNNRDEVPSYATYLALVLGMIGVATGYWIIYRAPVTKIVVNRQNQAVMHSRRGLAGTKVRMYKFEQVKQFCLVEENDSEGSLIWSLGMELSNGETVKISSLESHDEKFKRDFVFQTNEFLRKQMPSYRTNNDLMEES